MFRRTERAKGKRLEKIRLEDLNRLVRQGMVDIIHKKLARVEVV